MRQIINGKEYEIGIDMGSTDGDVGIPAYNPATPVIGLTGTLLTREMVNSENFGVVSDTGVTEGTEAIQ